MAIYECKNPNEHWIDDGWLKPVSWDWAEQADLFIIHRGLPKEVENKFPEKKKIVVSIIFISNLFKYINFNRKYYNYWRNWYCFKCICRRQC
jgi:hypothetical protein